MKKAKSNNIVPMIDPASYHVFEHNGDRFLFDVGTTSFSMINDVAYRLLDIAGEKSRPDVIEIFKKEFPEGEFSEIDKIFDDMRCKGFKSPTLMVVQKRS